MEAFRSEEALVGLIALAAVPWIVWILVRGLRDGRLPIGKGEVRRERAAAFHILFALYAIAASFMAFIGLDLLLGITARN